MITSAAVLEDTIPSQYISGRRCL